MEETLHLRLPIDRTDSRSLRHQHAVAVADAAWSVPRAPTRDKQQSRNEHETTEETARPTDEGESGFFVDDGEEAMINRELERVGAANGNLSGVSPPGWSSLLHAAATLSTPEIAEELLAAGPDTGHRDYDRTWLHLAASRGQLPTSTALLKAGVLVDALNRSYDTALHVALLSLESGHVLDSVIITLIDAGASLHLKNRLGDTPLHVAAARGHHSATRLLLDGGAQDCIDIRNGRGKTPRQLAVRNWHWDVAEILQGHGGRTTSDFEILWDEVLGEGGFGIVYRGIDLSSGHEVAVKVAKTNESARSDLVKESQVLGSLEHKNIIKHVSYQFDEETSEHRLFTEKLDDQSVASRIRMYGQMGENRIRRYLSGALQGLAYLHEQGILHRDVKPANMLIDIGAQVKLADFGCSSVLLGSKSQSVSTQYVLGTAPYMSPEILKAMEYSEGSDLWALACSVVEMATAQRPWAEVHKNGRALQNHIKEVDSHPVIPKHLTFELRELLATMFQRDPKLRGTASAALLATYFQMDLPEDSTPCLAMGVGATAGGDITTSGTEGTTATSLTGSQGHTTSCLLEGSERKATAVMIHNL